MKETGRCKALVVAGCLTQRYAEVLQQEMPEVDYFVGTPPTRRSRDPRGRRDRAVIPDPDYIADAATPRRNSMPRWTAYLKISEGCDNKCTFCIIPTLRGLQRSRPIADIVAEAQRLAAQGVVELNLVAQDLTAYGHDLPGKPRLHELLARWRKVRRALDPPALRISARLPRGAHRRARERAEPRAIPGHAAAARVRPDAAADAARPRREVPRALVAEDSRAGAGPDLPHQLHRRVSRRDRGRSSRSSATSSTSMRFDQVGVFQFSREEGTPSSTRRAAPAAGEGGTAQEADGDPAADQQASSSRPSSAARSTSSSRASPARPTCCSRGAAWGRRRRSTARSTSTAARRARATIVPVEIEQAGDYDLVGGIAGADGPARQIGALKPAPARPRFPILKH